MTSKQSDGLELTGLRCKNCGAPIEQDHIVPHLAMARCSYCGAVFGVQGLPLQKNHDAPLCYERPKVPMPKGIKVTNVGNVLRITRRWLHWSPIFLLAIFWCVGWDAALFVFLSLGGGTLVALPHLVIGIGATCGMLVAVSNSTTVQVEKGLLKIWHHPLWFGKKRLPATDVKQIYCKEAVLRTSNGAGQRSYEIYALLRHGGKERLLSGLVEPEQALYIEQKLERFLDIHDEPVRGEIPRRGEIPH